MARLNNLAICYRKKEKGRNLLYYAEPHLKVEDIASSRSFLTESISVVIVFNSADN